MQKNKKRNKKGVTEVSCVGILGNVGVSAEGGIVVPIEVSPVSSLEKSERIQEDVKRIKKGLTEVSCVGGLGNVGVATDGGFVVPSDELSIPSLDKSEKVFVVENLPKETFGCKKVTSGVS